MESSQIAGITLLLLIVFQFIILIFIGRKMGNLSVPFNENAKYEKIMYSYKKKLKVLVVTITLSFMSISLIDNFSENIILFIVVSIISFPLLYLYFIRHI